MTNAKFIKLCREQSESQGYVVFPEEWLAELTESQISLLVEKFGSNTLMRLPEKEIKFFEWLAINDENVWKDLWDDADAEPYVVGISFLPMLLAKNGRGFPICDLLNCENFYFSEQHLVDEESRIIIDTARNLFTEHKKLTPAQLLALEISFDPIDIWHFAYKYNMNLTEAKNAVKVLVQDKALVHLTDAAHLAALINF